MDSTLTLLIVDGHQGVREALLRRLQHAPGIQAVAAVGSIAHAVRLAQELAPDTVLYDPKTVEGDAVEAIGQLAVSGRCVIVLTSSLGEGEEMALARAGAAALREGRGAGGPREGQRHGRGAGGPRAGGRGPRQSAARTDLAAARRRQPAAGGHGHSRGDPIAS